MAASDNDDRPLWKLDRSEQRILLITFAGGVAAIIVGAAVIGIALALAHRAQRVGNSLPELAVYSVATVFMFAVWVSYIRWGRRGMPGRPLDLWPISSRASVAVGALLIGALVLTWIGVAAGIR